MDPRTIQRMLDITNKPFWFGLAEKTSSRLHPNGFKGDLMGLTLKKWLSSPSPNGKSQDFGAFDFFENIEHDPLDFYTVAEVSDQQYPTVQK